MKCKVISGGVIYVMFDNVMSMWQCNVICDNGMYVIYNNVMYAICDNKSILVTNHQGSLLLDFLAYNRVHPDQPYII